MPAVMRRRRKAGSSASAPLRNDIARVGAEGWGEGLYLMADGCFQNENITCKSRRRFDEADEKNPPSPIDCPKNGELRFPTGDAGETVLKMLRPETLKVRL